MSDQVIDQDPECSPDEVYEVPVCVRSFCATTVKAINKAEREVAHVITTANPDRVGDIVEAAGADMAHFLKHPVVVRDHSYKIEDIIGRAITLTVEEGGIFARTKYRDTPLGRDAFNLVAEGLGAWSIGFRPISFKAMKDEKGITKGFRFTKWELLEYSQVAIPMNPDAVQNAVTRGWVSSENVTKFFQVEESAKPREKASPETNAAPAKTSRVIRLTDSQLRQMAGLDRLIVGHRVSQDFAHLGE